MVNLDGSAVLSQIGQCRKDKKSVFSLCFFGQRRNTKQFGKCKWQYSLWQLTKQRNKNQQDKDKCFKRKQTINS